MRLILNIQKKNVLALLLIIISYDAVAQDSVRNNPFILHKAYYGVFQGGLLVGNNGSEMVGTLNTVNGYRWSNFISTGGVFGVDLYSPGVIFPLGVDIRGDFLKKATTPYWNVQCGYGLSFNKPKVSGGMMLYGGLGIKFALTPKTSFIMDIGYKQQFSHIDKITDQNKHIVEDHLYRRIVFKIGLMI